ncbi:hypothetical protein IMSAG013_00844 [Clostridiales bacterium]|nr:hypothetical protein IMSAG013_00844 [Clostridiales bacterium]
MLLPDSRLLPNVGPERLFMISTSDSWLTCDKQGRLKDFLLSCVIYIYEHRSANIIRGCTQKK